MSTHNLPTPAPEPSDAPRVAATALDEVARAMTIEQADRDAELAYLDEVDE